MKIIVLGNQSAFPAPGKHTAGYLLLADKNILVDIGSGIVSMFQQYISVDELDALVISHLHFDHISDFHILVHGWDLFNRLGKFEKKLTVYLPKGEKDRFIKICEANDTAKYLDIVNILEVSETFSIGNLKVSTVPTIHYIPTLAFRFENPQGKSIIYSSDTAYTEKLVTLAQNGDLFIAEATLIHDDLKPDLLHLSAKQAGEIAEKAHVKKLVLSHLWFEYDSTQLLKEAQEAYSGEVILAEEGMILEI